MASYTKPDDRLNETDLVAIITAALPPYAYRGTPREWTWTRPGGLWKLNLTIDGAASSITARLIDNPTMVKVSVRITRREVDAALRFLLLVDAIDHHPDDPVATPTS